METELEKYLAGEVIKPEIHGEPFLRNCCRMTGSLSEPGDNTTSCFGERKRKIKK